MKRWKNVHREALNGRIWSSTWVEHGKHSNTDLQDQSCLALICAKPKFLRNPEDHQNEIMRSLAHQHQQILLTVCCNIRSCFADSQKNGGCHVTSLAEVNKMESVLTILDLKGGVLIYELLCWFTELDFTDHRSWTGLLNPNSTVRTSEPSQNRF